MFDGGDEAICLNAFDLCGHKGGGEEWIFTEGLEVAPGTGLSHDVDHRGEEDILTECASFLPNGCAEATCDVWVERRCHCHGSRHRGCGFAYPDPCWAIGEAKWSDAKARHTGDVACLTEVIWINASTDEGEFFIQCQLPDEL